MLLILVALFLCCSTTNINYCSICPDNKHVMCKYRFGPSPSCKGYRATIITPKIQSSLVDLHNQLRNKVAMGLEERGKYAGQPTAANMKLMKWNEELAEMAERLVDQCFGHELYNLDPCRRSTRTNIGLNIYSGEQFNNKPDFHHMVTFWYDKVENYSSKSVKSFKHGHGDISDFGQYTQIVWALTEYIGCGHATYLEKTHPGKNSSSVHRIHSLVCYYEPAGNIPGEEVYKIGEPCTECEKDQQCDEEYEGLCGDMSTGSTEASHDISYSNGNKITKKHNHADEVAYERIQGIWRSGKCLCDFELRDKGVKNDFGLFVFLFIFVLFKNWYLLG